MKRIPSRKTRQRQTAEQRRKLTHPEGHVWSNQPISLSVKRRQPWYKITTHVRQCMICGKFERGTYKYSKKTGWVFEPMKEKMAGVNRKRRNWYRYW